MAFAAVSSLTRILDQTLQHQHVILENRQEVESLFEQVKSLQAMLQKKGEIITSLESQIIRAADKARRLIETHVTEQIIRSNNSIFSSHELLNEAKRELDLVDQRLKKIEGDGGEDEQPMIYSPARKFNAVGLDDDVREILNMLLSEEEWGLATISIVGMAGIGKTALARQVFNHPSVSVCFGIRGWVTLSESNDMRQILIDLLHSLDNCPEEMYENTTQELQDHLYNSLSSGTYLMVLDNLCDTQVLEHLSPIFVDVQNASRILVTTRLDNLGDYYPPHRMTLLAYNQRRQRLIQSSTQEADSLLVKVSHLHDILKKYSSLERKSSLENQIINAEKMVKDFIKSCIMEYKFTVPLAELKEEIDLIKQLVIKIENEVQHSPFEPPARNTNRTVGLDRDLAEIKNKLAIQSSKREIVSLVGMGGLGKTTLAKKVYNDKFTRQHFHIHAWVTISQSYDLQQVVASLLDSLDILPDQVRPDEVDKQGARREEVDKGKIGDLRLSLYQKLKNRKYLIVLDDVWDTNLQDLMILFPDDGCSSRILLTTRLEEVAAAPSINSCVHHVHFLDKDASWNLFCNKAFGEGGSCPSDLETIGKNIVQHCRGLPLAIVVAGGIMSRANTKDYWRNIAENLNSLLFSNEDDHCSKILSLSYTHLPQHLKKCFLYTGTFLGGRDISVSKLVKLWIAEGFLDLWNSNKLMEDIAYEYLSDLIGRSLVLVHKQSSTGKIKTCNVHDLVRDFCTQEAKTEMLLYMTDISLYGIPSHPSVPFILSIHRNPTNIFPYDDKKLSSLRVRSLHIVDPGFLPSLHHLNHEPVRVLDIAKTVVIDDTLWEVQKFLTHESRYLSCYLREKPKFPMPPSFILPNLQTLILHRANGNNVTEFPIIIWNMTEMRHVKASRLRLYDPVEGGNSVDVLENLQTLSQVYNFRWSKEVLERIPNLKKLGIIYELEESVWQHYSLENLTYLPNLEALTCTLLRPCPFLLDILTFPPSLRKLTLEGCGLPWERMKIICSLPNLEVLKLRGGSFEGEQWLWIPTDEDFQKLKYLLLEFLHLKHWTANGEIFPCLQRLIIRYCIYLEQIPHDIGEIPALELIEVVGCPKSLIDLVRGIEDEQLDYGNEGLQVRIQHLINNE